MSAFDIYLYYIYPWSVGPMVVYTLSKLSGEPAQAMGWKKYLRAGLIIALCPVVNTFFAIGTCLSWLLQSITWIINSFL